MQLFFDENIQDLGIYSIFNQEAIHISKVLRLKTGNTVNFTNGKGYLFECEIVETNKKSTVINILKKTYVEKLSTKKLHIAIAPTKSIDRFEWFVEKAVEIGVDRITPILCRYSERKFMKNERIEKVIISAMKQSLKFHKPQFDELIKFSDFVQNSNSENKFIAYCKAQTNLKTINITENNLFLVGPEGGFANFEFRQAKENNFIPLKISDYRLRTECL